MPPEHVGRCDECRLVARGVRYDLMTRVNLCPWCWLSVNPRDYGRPQPPQEALTRRAG